MKVDIQKVLDLVNSAREAIGMEPLAELPRGARGESRACPIARALGCEPQVLYRTLRYDQEGYCAARAVAQAWGTELIERQDARFVELPWELVEFVDRFDSGAFPDLIDPELESQLESELESD